MMGPMHAIMVIFEIVGVVLGVFVLYLIINMIVAETATNISVMKVLGFSQKEISNRVLNVNHILVCIGYLIGIPVAYMLSRSVIQIQSRIMVCCCHRFSQPERW